MRAVNNIVQSAPHVKTILARFDDNVAKFLLFMHFVMSCLHRRTELAVRSNKAKDATPTSFEQPFARSRLDKPEMGVTKHAFVRMERLAKLLDKDAMFVPFRAKEGEVPDFNPKSDPLVRRDNRKLSNENTHLKKDNDSYKHRLIALRSKAQQWQTHLDALPRFGSDQRNKLLHKIFREELPKIINEESKDAD